MKITPNMLLQKYRGREFIMYELFQMDRCDPTQQNVSNVVFPVSKRFTTQMNNDSGTIFILCWQCHFLHGHLPCILHVWRDILINMSLCCIVTMVLWKTGLYFSFLWMDDVYALSLLCRKAKQDDFPQRQEPSSLVSVCVSHLAVCAEARALYSSSTSREDVVVYSSFSLQGETLLWSHHQWEMKRNRTLGHFFPFLYLWGSAACPALPSQNHPSPTGWT